MQRRVGGRKGERHMVGQQGLPSEEKRWVWVQRSGSGLTLLISEAVARASITKRRRRSGQLQGVVVWR